MLRFNIIIAIYILLIIASFIFISNITQLLFINISATVILITSIIWGVSDIKLQMFVNSFNNNPKALNKFAITFDDGPNKQNTIKILDILEKYNAKASFFLIGENIEQNRDIAKKIHDKGHLITNHSYYHKNSFPYSSKKNIINEIEQTQAILKEITGKRNKYFRPPFGVTNTNIAKAIKDVNLKVIGWNIRTFDTKRSIKKETILKKVKNKLKSGDIILLHDKTENILWLTEEILKYATYNDIKAVTIRELQDNE